MSDKCPLCGSARAADFAWRMTCGTVVEAITGNVRQIGFTCIERQLAQRDAIIAKLPKTADGVAAKETIK